MADQQYIKTVRARVERLATESTRRSYEPFRRGDRSFRIRDGLLGVIEYSVRWQSRLDGCWEYCVEREGSLS